MATHETTHRVPHSRSVPLMVEVIKMALVSKHHTRRLEIGTLAVVGTGWHTGRTESSKHAKILGILGIFPPAYLTGVPYNAHTVA